MFEALIPTSSFRPRSTFVRFTSIKSLKASFVVLLTKRRGFSKTDVIASAYASVELTPDTFTGFTFPGSFFASVNMKSNIDPRESSYALFFFI